MINTLHISNPEKHQAMIDSIARSLRSKKGIDNKVNLDKIVDGMAKHGCSPSLCLQIIEYIRSSAIIPNLIIECDGEYTFLYIAERYDLAKFIDEITIERDMLTQKIANYQKLIEGFA